jgi:hypothetical protein
LVIEADKSRETPEMRDARVKADIQTRISEAAAGGKPLGLKELAIQSGMNPVLQDQADTLLRNKSVRQVLEANQPDHWVQKRAQQIRNDDSASLGYVRAEPGSEQDREENEKAWVQAIDEMATLNSINYSNGPIPLPIDQAPDSSYWRALVGKKAEIVGKDPRTGKPLIRFQTDAGWALDALSLPQTVYVSTGIPEKMSQTLYGKAPGTEDAKLFDPEYAKRTAAEKRSFQEIASETNIQNPYFEAAVKTGAGIGDVAFPDLLSAVGAGGKVVGAGAKAIAATEKGAKALAVTREIRAGLGIVNKADAVAHLDRVAEMEAATQRASRMEGRPLLRAEGETVVAPRPSAEDELTALKQRAATPEKEVADYARGVEATAEEAGKFGKPLVTELERRALSAISGVVPKSGPERTLLEDLVIGTTGTPESMALVQTGPGPTSARLAKNLAEYVEKNGSSPVTQSLLAHIQEGRAKAIESLRSVLAADTVNLSEKPVAALRAVVDAVVPEQKWTVLGALADTIGLGPKSKLGDQAYQAIKDGEVYLTSSERDAFTQNIRSALAGRDLPPSLIPDAMEVLTPQKLAAIDEYVSGERKLLKAERVGLEAEDAFRQVQPKVVVRKMTDFVATTFRVATSGSDPASDFEKAHLSRDIREAQVRCTRAIDAAVSDASKLKDEDMAVAYMEAARLQDKTGRTLLTSGTNHFDMFKAGVDLRLVGDAALRDLSRSYIPTETLNALVASENKGLEDLLDGLRKDLKTRKPVGEVMRDLQDATHRLTDGVVDPAGWRRFTSGVAAHGTQLPVLEELFGSGIVMTGAQRNYLMDTFAGSVGGGYSRAERAELTELRGALAEMEESRRVAQKNYDMMSARMREVIPHMDALKPYVEDLQESIAKLQRGKEGRQASLEGAEYSARARTMGLSPEAEYVPATLKSGGPPDLGNLIDHDTIEQVRRVQALLSEPTFIPSKVREEITKKLGQAMSRQGGTTNLGQYAVTMAKTGMTRGTWMVSPRYTLFNFYGDAGQTAQAHGMQVSIKNSVRSILQLAMASPFVGQALALTGNAEEARKGLQVAGDLMANPKKMREALVTMKRGGTLRQVAEQVGSLSEVNQILDGSDEVIRIGDQLISGKKLREVAVKSGVLDTISHGLLEDEIEVARIQTLEGGKTLRQIDPRRADKALRESVEDIVEGIGERQRVGLFITLIEHGADPWDAGKGVVDALYDYKYSMSESDRNVVWKILNPWWAWQKNANAQMTRSLFAPMGAYRMKVLATAPATAVDLVSEWYEEKSVDPFGVMIDGMSPQQHDDYVGFIAGMQEAYPDMTPHEIKLALRNVAPLGTNEGGIGSWAISDKMKFDYEHVVKPYMVAEQGDVDVPGYMVDRPMIKMRPTREEMDAMFRTGTASTANYYAYMLPPDNFEAYWAWVGAMSSVPGSVYSGVKLASEGAPIAGRSVISDVQTVMDPQRAPVVGIVLTTMGGKKVQTRVSDTVGAALTTIGVAEQVKKYNQTGFTSSSAPGVSNEKYVISNPALSLAWTTIGAPLSSIDTNLVRTGEDLWNTPNMKTLLKFGVGVPYAEILPAGTTSREAYDMGEGMQNVPLADAPMEGASYAEPPASSL